MPAPANSPAMREFGFGANRVLRPYQNPEAKSFFRTFRPSKEEVNGPDYNDYARQQDSLVLQEDLINQQLEDQQAERQQSQRKVARLEQIQDVEDQANEALAQGAPMDQVIQQFPALTQSPSFGNYMQQVRAIAPAQQTLAPSFRKLLKTPEERADWDEGWQKFGNVTQTDDHVRARVQQRGHRVELIDAGVPLAEIEKAGPLTPERAALLKQQYKRSVTGGDPRADKVFDTMNKMMADGAEDAEVKSYLDRMKSFGIDLTPPAKVDPVAAPVAGPYGIVPPVPPSEVEEPIPTPEQVRQARSEQINAPGNDENFFTAAIANKQAPIEDREKALEAFRQFVKNPPPKNFGSISDGLKYGSALEQKLTDAEKVLSVDKDREQAKPVWDKAKADMESKIAKFARLINATPETVLADIANNGSLTSEEATPEDVIKYGQPLTDSVPVRNLFAGRTGFKMTDKVPEFEPLKRLKNAGDLKLARGITWYDVLAEYLKEREGATVPQAKPNVQASRGGQAPVKIKSITEIK